MVRRCREDCDLVVVSIFVNPAQFNDPNDLRSYPRDPEGDRAELESEGTDLLFMPSQEAIYPEKAPIPPDVDVSHLEQVMEGAYRPGHFRGVIMVLDRLFDVVRPHCAYFGEKDHQQLLVVKELVRQRSWGIEVVGVPTVRDPDGLALSSRNEKLSEVGRRKALAIQEALHFMREHVDQLGVNELKKEAHRILEEKGMEPDYVEVAEEEGLKPLERFRSDIPVRAYVAASIEGVRLIDNMPLNP